MTDVISIIGESRDAVDIAKQLIPAFAEFGGFAYKDPIVAEEDFLALIVSTKKLSEDELMKEAESLWAPISQEDEDYFYEYIDGTDTSDYTYSDYLEFLENIDVEPLAEEEYMQLFSEFKEENA